MHALQARGLFEDGLMERGQFRPGIQAKVAGQLAAQVGVAVDRVGLPPGPVEGKHVRGAQPLPQRVTGHQFA